MTRLNSLSMQHDLRRRATRLMKIAKLYQDGVPIADIASEYELSQATVAKYARVMGCPKRRPGANTEVRKAVAQAYKEQKPIKEICAETGIDRKTLWVICKEAGLPLRRPRSA